MSYRSCCRVLLFYFILCKEFNLYDARNFEINDDTSEPIPIEIDGRKFVLNVLKKTWWDAVLNCRKNGMILGEVRTMNEARLLSEKMLKSRPVAIENAWIGGHKNSSRKLNTEWRWLSNGNRIRDNNELWLGHPEIERKSDLESTSPNHQCLLLDWHLRTQTTPSYVRASCDRKREFICQKGHSAVIQTFKPIISASAYTIKSPLPKVSSSDHRSLATPAITYPTPTTPMFTEKPSTKIKRKKKRKEKKVIELTTLPPPITATTEDEYLDYRMWELGRAQMRMWKKKMAKENRRKSISGTVRNKSDSLKRIKIQESNDEFTTTQEPEVRTPTIKKPLKPLQLYYAFEGPMVGGLTATPMPHEQYNGDTRSVSARRYHKYISRRKYNQYMARKQTKRY